MSEGFEKNLGDNGKFSVESYQVDGLSWTDSEFLFELLGLSNKEFFQKVAFGEGSKEAEQRYKKIIVELSRQPIRVKMKKEDFGDLFSGDQNLSYLRSEMGYDESSELYLSFSENGGILVEVVNSNGVKEHSFNNFGYRNLAKYILFCWQRNRTSAKELSSSISSIISKTRKAA